MLNLINTIILGIVEGFTEFLPISSTAHLTLASNLLHIIQSDYMKSFEIIIQAGAILAVVCLYWKKLFNWEIFKRIIIAFIPTGILGLIFYKVIKHYLLGNTNVILWALFLGGILIILFEKLRRSAVSDKEITDISYKQCLGLGLFQSIAMVPGVSRSAATIIGGMLMGLKREVIVEFSFLLAVPTMIAATGLDLVKNVGNFSLSQIHFLLIGFIVSFIMAVISIKFLLNYIRKHTFTVFGAYRIIIAIVFFIVLTLQIK
ncbi:MAG: undecaprenyl-diphosphate phosphatase [Candidatus Paceibacterota bacterium]|jgi:undecaprenyl-diphosphatase